MRKSRIKKVFYQRLALESGKPDSVSKQSSVLCPALGLGKGTSSVQLAGCSGGDCPFHPFSFFRKEKDSSLLLSQSVNSLHVFLRRTSPFGSPLARRILPFSCPDFPPPNGGRLLPLQGKCILSKNEVFIKLTAQIESD
jgi:hypothetical protein